MELPHHKETNAPELGRGRIARRTAAALGAALIGIALCANAQAQKLPDSIRIIVPFAAGGGIDVLGRVLAQELSPKLGRPVIVENRVGAGGNLGVDFTAKAPPDGSVLALASSGPLANNKLLYNSLPYDPEKDLTPIAFAGESPMVIMVKKSSPYQKLGDLLGDDKAGQIPLNFGSPGNGTIGHLTQELLRGISKREITLVTYRGGSPVVADILSGVLDGGGDLLTIATVEHARAGSLRILAVTSAERVPSAPEIPTAAEQGFPQLRSATWFALVGPKNMPPDLVERLNREVNSYVSSPAAIAKLQDLGIRAQSGPPAMITQRMQEELKKWAPIVQSRNIKLD